MIRLATIILAFTSILFIPNDAAIQANSVAMRPNVPDRIEVVVAPQHVGTGIFGGWGVYYDWPQPAPYDFMGLFGANYWQAGMYRVCDTFWNCHPNAGGVYRNGDYCCSGISEWWYIPVDYNPYFFLQLQHLDWYWNGSEWQYGWHAADNNRAPNWGQPL